MIGNAFTSQDSSRAKLVPFVDTNTLLAIETLFRKGTKDPWAVSLACTFTDLFIYADSFRFTFGARAGTLADADWTSAPVLAQQLHQRDSSAVSPLVLPIDEPVQLHDDWLDESFQPLVNWGRNNRRKLRQWLDTHNVDTLRAMQDVQLGRSYYFNLDVLRNECDLERTASELGVSVAELLYAFDNLLRGPLYGKLTGSDQHYLNHPLRDVRSLPTAETHPGPPPRVTITFHRTMEQLVRHVSFDEYCVMLHDWRGAVRDRGIHKLPPGEVEPETRRKIAAELQLPPRLKGMAKAAVISGGIIGSLAAIPALGPATAIAGAAVSVSSALWTGRLPRKASRIKWLRWAYEWDIEEQENT